MSHITEVLPESALNKSDNTSAYLSLQQDPNSHFSEGDAEDALSAKVKGGVTYQVGINIMHEFCGTFMFVYSIICVATRPNASTTDVAFSISTAAFVYSHVFNKAHFNSVITLYLWGTDALGRTFDQDLIELYPEIYRPGTKTVPRDSFLAVSFQSIVHLITQLVAATFASWMIYSFPFAGHSNIGVTVVSQGLRDSMGDAKAWFVCILLEFVITYALMYSLNIGDEMNHRPGRSKEVFFSIGPPIVLFLGVRTTGDFTGASFNPARSFGPALVSGEWYGFGYYMIAHALAIVAAIAAEHHRFHRHIKERRTLMQREKRLKQQEQ